MWNQSGEKCSKDSQKLVKYLIVGAGERGSAYAIFAQENPQLAQIVGVAEPRAFFRERLLSLHDKIPKENIFNDWREAVKIPKFADAVIIATPDSEHFGPAIAFSDLGYHILLEKPMSVSEQECIEITEAVKRNNVILAVGHVLRYTPYSQKIKELISSGILGKIINIQHVEPVGYWHFAHSYVRGNWRNEKKSTFSLLAKSCHDIDWIRYMMGVHCKKVTSFGNLNHFRKENKPEGAKSISSTSNNQEQLRCIDCTLQNECPYSATRIYLERVKEGSKDWPVRVITSKIPDIEAVTEALEKGPYGRCVYECDNDVCDNQIVNMEFEGGRTASFTMIAFSSDICVRKTRIYGTLGELECDGNRIRHTDFRGVGNQTEYCPKEHHPTNMTGHSYGDYNLMRSFIAAVGTGDPSKVLSGPDETLESHRIVFAAENSRLAGGLVIDTSAFY